MEWTRIVFKPSMARQLLKAGYTICDLKPKKQQDGTIDYSRCMFVFTYKDGIDEKIKELSE